jgi:anaerobic selenocysteine-containing dehydrogenase
VIDRVYAHARMDVDEIRSARGIVHEARALVAQPADPGCTARFELAPMEIVDEIAAVASEATGADVLVGAHSAEYPFRLVSRRLKAVINSLGTELPALRSKGTTNPAYMHPDDLGALGVVGGDLVEITSPHGAVIAVAAAAPDVKRGVVSMAHSWGDASLDDAKVRDIGAPTNRLVTTVVGFDAITGMAVQSAIPVAVTKQDSTNGGRG